MPIAGIEQPEILPVGEEIRLRRFDKPHAQALAWYQDEELVWLVDGVRAPYTMEKLERMYAFLNGKGELYWIEYLQDGEWRAIGDVAWWPEDLPMVIGEKDLRGKGIGRRVLDALAGRAKALGLEKLRVQEIYHYNAASRRCYEAAGFRVCGETDTGVSLERIL